MTEGDYRSLQALGAFDHTTSSWIVPPPEIRQLGGALFGDRRYGQVFVYHRRRLVLRRQRVPRHAEGLIRRTNGPAV